MLSIILPVLNDQEELVATVQSIRDTAGFEPEVVVVDDCSTVPVAVPQPLLKNLIFYRNVKRIGVAGSRHKGAELATGEHLLFLDAHMRCEEGWYEKAMDRIQLPERQRTVYNGCCLGLGFGAGMDMKKHVGEYCGASLHLYIPDDNTVFASKWLPGPVADDQEIPSVMGAIYFVPRKFFFEIGGLKSLRSWGDDEPFISLKAWLAGGEVRMLKTVRIGHMFRAAAPYRTDVPDLVYNKIRACTVLCGDLSTFLISKIADDVNKKAALKLMKDHAADVAEELALYKNVFTHDIHWFLKKWGLPDPRLQGVSPGLLEAEFNRVCSAKSDISEHLETLSRLASTCNIVAELGVRYADSTIALIYGRPKEIHSYDISIMCDVGKLESLAASVGSKFTFHHEDSLKATLPDGVDMLFVDSLHRFLQVKNELCLHAPKVKKYIAFHDVAHGTFGDKGDDGQKPGIWQAIVEFLRVNPDWELMSYASNCNGLAVIKRK